MNRGITDADTLWRKKEAETVIQIPTFTLTHGERERGEKTHSRTHTFIGTQTH